MEQLGLFPQYHPNDLKKPTNANATLHQFENALASVTAAMYWAGIYTQIFSITMC
jgi:hypothetical protein